jgi:hypothetical protein
MQLSSVRIKTPSQHIAMKNLVRFSCFQIHVPMAVAARDILPGEQLLVDYTAGGKNKYLLTQNQINKLSKDGTQVSPCLDADGKPCKCRRFFITSTAYQSASPQVPSPLPSPLSH